MEITGIVFNIQKFSIHDGPGVRTTVFLKGCPLGCAWCANPESQLPRIQIMYDRQKCLRCQTCTNVCPAHAVTMGKDQLIHVDVSRCKGCLACVRACPGRALTGAGEEKTVSEVLDECMKDFDFYEESAGGVTISGGEGMSQPEFTEALIRKLKERGVHTAIETTGFVSPAVFRRLAPQFDLLLFDVKHYDAVLHEKGTGVRNEQIVANLTWAHEQGLSILPRIPVIPKFNDRPEDAKGIAALLKHIGLTRVQLLPFHQMGEQKYKLLNRDYSLTGEKALHPEDLADYQKVFLEAGLECFF